MIKMVFINSKKGQIHIEVILSFILFVGAIVFLFVILNYSFQGGVDLSIVDDIQIIIMREISYEIGRLSVIADGSDSNYCYYFLDNDYDGNYLEVVDSRNIRKYTLYFSDELFNSNNAPHKDMGCSVDSYNLGVYFKENVLIYSEIADLKDDYDSDYNGLRSSLGILDDFSFSVKNVDGLQISELSVARESPKGVDRIAKEFPIIVMDDTGNYYELILNVGAW